MKTFIINTAKGAVTSFKKQEVGSMLMGKEWKMLSDEPSITAKYIFLNDGKLLLSVNGLSTYSTWQMATESSLIMDEGVATFLYKVVHIDKNIVVLNLDGTDNYCFLINDASQSLAKATFEDIQWHLYRSCSIDILSEEQKQFLKMVKEKERDREMEEFQNQQENEEEDRLLNKCLLIVTLVIMGLLLVASLL